MTLASAHTSSLGVNYQAIQLLGDVRQSQVSSTGQCNLFGMTKPNGRSLYHRENSRLMEMVASPANLEVSRSPITQARVTTTSCHFKLRQAPSGLTQPKLP